MHFSDRARAAASLRALRGRLLAASAVALAAAVVTVAVNRSLPASALETIPESTVPLSAVAVRGADAACTAANLEALRAGGADAAASSYSASVPMYGTLQLEGLALQGWQSGLVRVCYASADESICTVSESGLVTGVSAGQAAVTVTALDAQGNTASAVCTVTVRYADPPIETVTLSDSEALLHVGGTGLDLSVSCTPAAYAAAMPAPAYTSSDETVVTVDAAGHMTAVAPGEAVVTAAVGSLTAACTVTVEEKSAPASALAPGTGGISLLSFDPAMIAGIGNQSDGRCSWYALRYARTILDGTPCSGDGMWNGGAVWSAGGYTDSGGTLSDCLAEIYSELAAGRPVIVHLQNTTVSDGDRHTERVTSMEYWQSGSGWNEVFYPHISTSSTYGHWVCIVGCSADADPAALRESDFYALDPARVTDGTNICVTRLLDGTLWVGNHPLKVAG